LCHRGAAARNIVARWRSHRARTNRFAAANTAGAGGLWLYRVFFAGDTMSMPAVAIDGVPAGYALAGTSFYRDVPAGTHVVSVESRGTGLTQQQQIAVGPGQELYVQIASMPNWEEDARGRTREPSFAVMIMSPRMAWLQMPLTAFQGGS
jgi:hypothetical protein